MAKLHRYVLAGIISAFGAGFLISFAGPAIAAQFEMTCQNPRRAYLVVFDDKAKTFKLETPGEITPYRVERADNKTGELIVRGNTVKGGPDFVAYLGAKKQIVFMVGGKIIQTDPCK